MRYLFSILITVLLVFQASAQQQEEAPKDLPEKFLLEQNAIIDPQNILSPEQVVLIRKEQKLLLENHRCMVSYGFYGIHHSQMEIRRTWTASIPATDQQFHILINIGSFLKNHNIDIQFKNPPLLDDINEVENILASATQNIQSERGLDAILEASFVSINDELAYLSTRPLLEKDQSDLEETKKNAAFKAYIIKLVKIALCIIVPLIALFIIWNIYSNSRNKKPYYFPETKTITRLGAPHGASSITQQNR